MTFLFTTLQVYSIQRILLTSLLSFSKALSCCRLVSSSWLTFCLSVSLSFSISSRRTLSSRFSWLSLEIFLLASSSSDLNPLTSVWRASSASELSVALACSWFWGGCPIMLYVFITSKHTEFSCVVCENAYL